MTVIHNRAFMRSQERTDAHSTLLALRLVRTSPIARNYLMAVSQCNEEELMRQKRRWRRIAYRLGWTKKSEKRP